jgi:DNA-binding transcriptional ArsR family regulator
VPSTWSALADPNRRAVLELLRERPRPVGELVARLGLSQPATSKHLRVLRDGGFVSCRVAAQQRIYRLESGPLRDLDGWLEPYRRLWGRSLDALARHLDNQE